MDRSPILACSQRTMFVEAVPLRYQLHTAGSVDDEVVLKHSLLDP